MTKRQLIILGVSLLIIILIIFQLATGKKAAEKKDELSVDNKKYVKVHRIKNDTVQLYVSGFGRVSSARNIVLSAEVQGLLQGGSVNLKPGQSFSQGQLLFKIKDTEAQLALKARKSGFLNIVSTILPDIKIDFPSNYSAWSNFLNKIDLDGNLPELPEFSSSKEKTFLAAKNVLAEYYNIRGDEERIKKYSVYAPFNGSVVDVTAEVGANVNPGSPIATIIKTMSLEVAIPVDPSDIKLLDAGNKVMLTSEDKKQSWEGKVIRIGQNINPNTQSIDVYVSANNDDNSLYNGMYVEAAIEAGRVLSADEIPRRSFLNSGYVYTVKDSLLIKKKPVVLKRNNSTYVVKNFEDGELVVIEPIPGAVDSMKVAPLTKK